MIHSRIGTLACKICKKAGSFQVVVSNDNQRRSVLGLFEIIIRTVSLTFVAWFGPALLGGFNKQWVDSKAGSKDAEDAKRWMRVRITFVLVALDRQIAQSILIVST